MARPLGVSDRRWMRPSDISAVRETRRVRTKISTARLTCTLSIAVRSATSRADSPGVPPSTAMARHSGMVRPKRSEYALAMASDTRFDSTDSRYGRKRSRSSRGLGAGLLGIGLVLGQSSVKGGMFQRLRLDPGNGRPSLNLEFDAPRVGALRDQRISAMVGVSP